MKNEKHEDDLYTIRVCRGPVLDSSLCFCRSARWDVNARFYIFLVMSRPLKHSPTNPYQSKHLKSIITSLHWQDLSIIQSHFSQRSSSINYSFADLSIRTSILYAKVSTWKITSCSDLNQYVTQKPLIKSVILHAVANFGTVEVNMIRVDVILQVVSSPSVLRPSQLMAGSFFSFFFTIFSIKSYFSWNIILEYFWILKIQKGIQIFWELVVFYGLTKISLECVGVCDLLTGIDASTCITPRWLSHGPLSIIFRIFYEKSDSMIFWPPVEVSVKFLQLFLIPHSSTEPDEGPSHAWYWAVPVTIILVLLIAGTIFFWWRRRKAQGYSTLYWE